MERLSRIRDLQRTIAQIEQQFIGMYSLNLNEAMLLDLLCDGERTSGDLGNTLGISPSNTSKVIRNVEARKLIDRMVGTDDRRQMYFVLTEAGRKMLDVINASDLDLPDNIRHLVNDIQ